METIKVLSVGDTGVGKRSLYISYVTNKFPQQFETDYSSYVTLHHDGDVYTLALYDIRGQEDYERLRPLSYPDTDVFLVCFSVVSPFSLENVKEKWVPEVRQMCPTTPILLVGLQIDLRVDTNVIEKLAERAQQPIAYETGDKLAKNVGAVKYMECSALTQKGMKEVFEEALRAVISHPDPKAKKGCVLQ